MIKFCYGNIFNSSCEAIVCPVNCKGVMGAGLALKMKLEAPANFKVYRNACTKGQLSVGKVLVVPTQELPNHFRYIINFPTKDDWKDPSEIDYIVKGLRNMIQIARSIGLTSIAIPALGCGCGKLDWSIVRVEIENTLIDLGCNKDPHLKIEVYERGNYASTQEAN